MTDYAVGDWVHHRPQAAVPAEQRVKVPMIIMEIDDSGITCTFEGAPAGGVYKFSPMDLAPVDFKAEEKAMEDKSKAVKDANKPPEQAAQPKPVPEMKHDDIKAGSKR